SGLERLDQQQVYWKAWAGSGLAIAACILLRPDGGILLAAIGLYLACRMVKAWRQSSSGAPAIQAAVLLSVCALAPLAPWTIRNLRTLHHFQPLAPRYATANDELAERGFNRWVRTWIADYASVEEIYWNVPGDKIDADKLPSRAFDSASETETTRALIDDYNQSAIMTAELDARFGALAAQRIQEHPIRYYVWLPALRIADMCLRPRTELLPPDVRWWEFNDDTKASVLAVTLGLLNLAYVGAALFVLIWRFSAIRWVGLLLGFVLLRTAFLGTLENPEPRYTLECYPVVIVLAASLISGFRSRSLQSASRDSS
ncbi:MAG TPA: hypothetical protein VNW47_08170, partial [Terriglobales bacterium]|nr:hypothetical protein [Terriglobales bacterium]